MHSKCIKYNEGQLSDVIVTQPVRLVIISLQPSSELVPNPLNQLLHLNPPLIHRLAVQHHHNQILITGSKARPCSLGNTGLNALKPILQQFISVLNPVSISKSVIDSFSDLS